MIRKVYGITRIEEDKILMEYELSPFAQGSATYLPSKHQRVFDNEARLVSWLLEEWNKPRYNSPGDSPPVDDFL